MAIVIRSRTTQSASRRGEPAKATAPCKSAQTATSASKKKWMTPSGLHLNSDGLTNLWPAGLPNVCFGELGSVGAHWAPSPG